MTEPKPTCETCNDTHRMTLGEAMVSCTRCPVPCERCRIGGNGAYCETTPCACECHRDFLDEVVDARTSKNADFPPMVAEAEIARLKRRLRRQQIRLAYILACLGLLIGGVLLAENWALGCLAIGVNAGDSFRGWVEHD